VKRTGPVLALLLLSPAFARAQQDSALREAVRLATEGQADSARSLVRARLAATPPSDAGFPEVLYTAGVVATSPDTALRYFRRTSVEYSESAWADRALLRVAQITFAAGDLNTAYQSAQRVLTDYPFSPVRATAAFWAGRAQLDLGDLPGACRNLTLAADSAALDVELSNRARFYIQRCQSLALVLRPDTTGVAPVTGDTAGAPAAAAPLPPPPPGAAAAATWAVQVSAVRSPASADQAMRQLRTYGWEPRVSRDADGFLRVRVGRFKTRAEATRLAADIRRKVGGAPFVVEEP
jgi:hypothetical protein